MSIQKAVRNLEARKGCLIIHFVDGDELKIRMESVELKDGKKVDAAVVRYKDQIIWTSVDAKA